MIIVAPERFELTPEHVLKVKLGARQLRAQLVHAKNILKEIAQRVNSNRLRVGRKK